MSFAWGGAAPFARVDRAVMERALSHVPAGRDATTKSDFEKLWDDQNTVPITESWIASYERFLNEPPTEKPEAVRSKRSFRSDGATSALGSRATAPLIGSQPTESSFGIGLSSGIRPNKMQESALEALDVLHRRHESRALLVSATGTGKTLSFGFGRGFYEAIACFVHRASSKDPRRLYGKLSQGPWRQLHLWHVL